MKPSTFLNRFLPYYGKYKHILILDLFCAGLTSICALVLPMIMRNLTNMAPTTLAALGCSIEGEYLGLGVNLFSGKPTLIEKMGYDRFDLELSLSSDYYAEVFRLEEPEETENDEREDPVGFPAGSPTGIFMDFAVFGGSSH